MKVILKPGGIVLLVAAISALTVVALRQKAQDVPLPIVALPKVVDTVNLAQNPDMSVLDAGGKPDGFGDGWIGHGKLITANDTGVFHSAPNALRVDTDGKSAQGQVALRVPVESGKKYRMKGFVRGTGTGLFTIAVQFYDKDSHPLGFQHLTYTDPQDTWRECDSEVVVPDGAVQLGYLVYIEGNGTAWLDDIAVSPVR